MKSLLKLLFLGIFALSNAHTVWVQTVSNAEINTKHEIRIFFGEIDEPTPTAKWFSDINQLEIKIISPSGKTDIVKEKVQKDLYYASYFSPKEQGLYKIQVNHLVRDTHRGMKITYQSVAFVNTKKEEHSVQLGNEPLELVVKNQFPQINEVYTLKALLQGKTKAREKVKIVAENGWEKNLTTDENGEVSFKPLWKGKYLVEYALSEKKSGDHNGKPFETDYQMISYFINVE